jgi:predicted PurR-regulated permease PerM
MASEGLEPNRGAPSSWGRTLPLLRIASLFVIVGGLRVARPVLLPLLLGLFLAVLSAPILESLRRYGVRRSLAIVVTFLAVVGVVTVLGLMVSGAVAGFVENLPRYRDLLAERYDASIDWLEVRSPGLAQWLSPAQLDFQSVFDLAGNILGGTVRGAVSAVSFLVMTLIALLFLLAEASVLPEKLRHAFGDRGDLVAAIGNVAASTQRYLAIKTAISLGTGLLIAVWTWLLGVEFPLVWGLVAFFLNYIPVVGSIIAGVPACLLALAQLGLGRASLVALGYLAVNMVIGNVLEPLWMGRGFGLSPFGVLLSLVFWGWVWGPTGMILSVPLTMILKIILDHTGQLRWLVMILAPEPPPSPAVRAPG